MNQLERTVIELRAGPFQESDLVVAGVRGRERLSDLFAFEVEFAAADGSPLELADLGGAEACLRLGRPGGSERRVHGILWAVSMAQVAAGKPRYQARLVPALERLRHVHRSRVFQNTSVPDIVKKVLDDAGVKHRVSTSGSYAKREYCVQYRESDLDFVRRLLEEAGIFFWFEHAENEHVMVLADAAGGCLDLPGGAAVPFRRHEGKGDASEDEHLFRLERDLRQCTGKATVKDFDFERPELQVVGAYKDPGDALGLERFEYPAGFRDPGLGGRLARTRLEELRFGAGTCAGEGNCLRFGPGAKIEVTDHPLDAFNAKLLLVEVSHEARQQEGAGEQGAMEHGYRNRFVAIETSVPYRPRRTTPRPRAAAETATVVGPGGEEIHTDAHGSVKVQFHWDREGKKDDSSSCWIRAAQAWAGPAWGASFVPRIGQEVLVRFLEGDPDRPILAGAIYNGAHPPPIALPGEKTKSTLRTDSSQGGGGSNELRFEDAKGSEEVFVHAQKNETIEVLDGKAQRVGLSEALRVEKDRSRTVHGNQTLRVAQNDASRIDANQGLTVTGNRSTRVGGGHFEAVRGNQAVTVATTQTVSVVAASAVTVGAAAALSVGGGYFVNVGGVLNEGVGGVKAAQIGGAHVEIVGGAREETVRKNSVSRVGGDFDAEVKGSVTLTSGKDQEETVGGKFGLESKEPASFLAKSFKLEADTLTVVVGGNVALKMEKSGNIQILGSTVTIEGS
jgi:type VI secretion system secreted protein VgrG